MSSKRQQDDLFLYGGPYPTFVRLHALVGMMVFSFYMLYPSMMSSVFLNQQIEINVQLKLLSQLYGILGLCICTHLFFEPVLTRRGALIHGLLSIGVTMIMVINRSVIRDHSLYASFYFAICGVYFVVRSPNAVPIPTSPQDIKRLKSPPKMN